MTRATHPAVGNPTAPHDIADNQASFRRALLATNRTNSTVLTYSKAIEQLDAYLATAGMPRLVGNLRREHIESFLIHLQTVPRTHPATRRTSVMVAATVAQRYRSLQQFFRYLVDEGEIKVSPMANMHPPHIPEAPPPIITEDQMRNVIRLCDEPTFAGRRDAAILRLFYDTGVRRAEMTGLPALISTSTTRRSGSPARVAASAPSPSAGRPPKP